ncbi:MAG: hypothetical protein RR875_06920, partial [Clostridium sp.]
WLLGFEVCYYQKHRSISSQGRYDHFDTLPGTFPIIQNIFGFVILIFAFFRIPFHHFLFSYSISGKDSALQLRAPECTVITGTDTVMVQSLLLCSKINGIS